MRIAHMVLQESINFKIDINLTKPGHFSRTLSKGPNTTTWIWNLHADAHDFDSHTSDLEEISRKVFSAHFGQLGLILIWLSGCDTKSLSIIL